MSDVKQTDILAAKLGLRIVFETGWNNIQHVLQGVELNLCLVRH